MASLDELREDVAELQKFHEQATRPKVKDLLYIQVRKLQSEITKLTEQAAGEEDQATRTVKPEHEDPSAATSKGNQRYTVDLKTYAWDQSDKFVKIYVTLPGVQNIDAANITSDYKESAFRLHVEDLDGKNHLLHVVHLWEDLVPDKCYHKVKTDMMLLMLKKSEDKKTWAYVTKKEDKMKNKKKPENADPQDSLMSMLKDMYEDGDDDMRRTIAEAYTKSRDKDGPKDKP